MNGQAAVLTPHSSCNFSFSRQCYVNPVVLSTFQRILLTNSGTSTDLSEIYTGELTKVKKSSENIRRLNDDLLPMQLNENAKVRERKVLLQGGVSKRYYLYAESIVALERLDQ